MRLVRFFVLKSEKVHILKSDIIMIMYSNDVGNIDDINDDGG